ncbi:MAG: GH92 family glycosyl hydrolase [Clostridiales bacterium]|nr:GH92 family glycosyl hydrolase [Clostridiales bacterium]
MLRIIRTFVSLIVGIEMLFSGAVFAPKAEIPEKETGEYTQYVNPFIGTGGIPWACAMLSPAACTPFGCVRVGPDTCAAGGLTLIKTSTSGYYREHGHMLGFSLGRLSGTGARDYGMFRVTPCVNGKKPNCLPYLNKNESAYPGYYGVYLPTGEVYCEMTATSHCAIFRFSFKGKSKSEIYIDASSCLSSGKTENTALSVDDDGKGITAQTTLFGTFSGRYGGLPVYMKAGFDTPVEKITPSQNGVTVSFAESEVVFRTGVSFVSTENACLNLECETGGKDFNAVREYAVNEWENRLSSIQIEADEETKEIFYTALYHSMIMPTDFTDCNGEYLGFDKKVHTAQNYTYRTDMSLWDTCRTTHSLYTLIAPDIQIDCLNSLLDMAGRGGVLPRWPMGAGYSGSMFGNPANIIITESYLKGFDFDAESACDYMVSCGEGEIGDSEQKDDIKLYNKYGYLPDDLTRRYSVSKTLEFSWQNDAVSRLCAALGRDEEAKTFAERAGYYKNLWDDKTGYFMPKTSDGSFKRITTKMTSFFDDIFGTKFFKAFCEGSAAHWRWSATQDVDGLIELFGGNNKFVTELEKFMKGASGSRADINPGADYWIGNQHDIHTPWLFTDAGRTDLTQKWVRWTLKERFSTDIDGLDGNDDGGTLSSWYVLAAIGIYPVAGTDRYYIGSPCVDKAVINFENGNKLTITANNNSEKNIYVSSVTLNSEDITNGFITHGDLTGGGNLTFEMSDK